MASLDPATPPVLVEPTHEARRVWKFWGTALWGFLVFVAMFVGQIAVVIFFLFRGGRPEDFGEAVKVVASSGLTISLSVIGGLPAVAAAVWLPIHFTSTSFADYLALRWTPWKNLVLGVIGLVVLVEGWDLLSKLTGREVLPEFMIDVLKSARNDNVVWLLVVAICVAAPIAEEFFARGFLYRGWSESFLKVPGAIVLSSLAWTSLHLQYDWYFFGEVFCIGLWFGYMRYRSNSTWLTIVLHGLNNLGAVMQTIWLAG
jgi:membrane protease YdiL (CAAX protease family)